MIKHPDYPGRNGHSNDICLVRVEPMELNGLERDILCLPEQGGMVSPDAARAKTRDETECYVAGWGKLSQNGNSPDNLRSVHVNIYSDSYCLAHSKYPDSQLNLEVEFCAGEMGGGKDSCQGDSGGPLICIEKGEPVQYGIVSWGIGCAGEKYPGIYTQLGEYIDWIASHIQVIFKRTLF